jgi:hypothetical protein
MKRYKNYMKQFPTHELSKEVIPSVLEQEWDAPTTATAVAVLTLLGAEFDSAFISCILARIFWMFILSLSLAIMAF